MLGKNLIQAATGAAGGDVLGVEDVFSTYLYTGNGSTQTITNGIDLAGEGGLVWLKQRSGGGASERHGLFDTERGVSSSLVSNSTDAASFPINGVSAFNSDGFNLGSQVFYNASSQTFASWTFRKAPKFFDVVTYTGTGTGTTQTINHSLGTTPGLIIIKKTDGTSPWIIWHRSLTSTYYLQFSTAAANDSSNTDYFGNNVTTVEPTSTTFTVGQAAAVNSGDFVAYLFAHDAGGFGDSGEESVIKCGSYTHGSGVTEVNVGFEPQWLLIKRTDTSQSWFMFDTMRGWTADANRDAQYVCPNNTAAEAGIGLGVFANGFRQDAGQWGAGGNYIYIAIRRGPMKTPTDATKVFAASLGAATTPAFTSNFPVDLALTSYRSGGGGNHYVVDRIRGQKSLETPSTAAEGAVSSLWKLDQQTGFAQSSGGWDSTHVCSMFRRAPGFFDVVAYTETANPGTYSHSLGVAPEMIITKRRDNTSEWGVYHKDINTAVTGGWPALNRDNGWYLVAALFGTAPTSSVFTVDYQRGTSSQTHIAYLFATCPGVSKVGSYTGTGTTLNIDCGFTAGARFVLIRRTDSTYDWYVWDSARGIVSGSDPYLLLNSNAAEITYTDYIDPLASGFQINTAAAAINASGGSYIFLAIA